MPKVGLEPTSLSRLPPQGSVSTISPLRLVAASRAMGRGGGAAAKHAATERKGFEPLARYKRALV